MKAKDLESLIGEAVVLPSVGSILGAIITAPHAPWLSASASSDAAPSANDDFLMQCERAHEEASAAPRGVRRRRVGGVSVQR